VFQQFLVSQIGLVVGLTFSLSDFRKRGENPLECQCWPEHVFGLERFV